MKITNVLLQIFFQVKNVIFWRFSLRNWNGLSHNIETFHKEKSGVLEKKLENENFIPAALHALTGFQRSDQSQSSNLDQPTNGGLVLKYFLSEKIHTQEIIFLISWFPITLTA